MAASHPTLGGLRKAFVDEAEVYGIAVTTSQFEQSAEPTPSPTHQETLQQDIEPIDYMGHPYYQLDATQYPARPQKRTAPSQELREPGSPNVTQTAPKILKRLHDHTRPINPTTPKQLEHADNPYISADKYQKVANGRYGYEIDTVLNIFKVGHGTMNTRDHSMQINFQLQGATKQEPCHEQGGFEFPPSYDWNKPVSVSKYLTVAEGRYQHALDTILNIFVDGYGFLRMQDGDSNINFELECTNAQCACSDCFP